MKEALPKTAAALLALSLGLTACAPDRLRTAEPAPAGYLRRLVLVVEQEADYRPVAGALVTVTADPPAVLVEPASGQARTGARGEVALVFAPPARYDQATARAGDLVVEYAVKALITVARAGRPPLEFTLDDLETFARYRDPVYRGLDRQPDDQVGYYTVAMP